MKKKWVRCIFVILCILVLIVIVNFMPTLSLKTDKMTELEGKWINVYYETEAEAAKDVYEYYNTKDNDLGRVPNQGDTWEVSYDRLQVLLGNNKNHRQYVDLIKRIPPKKSAK